MTTSPLVSGGVLKGIRHLALHEESDEEGGPRSQQPFAAHTMPHIESDTMIVAVTSPTLHLSRPDRDGWFLSDFYAFNYLLNGLGASQTWLTRVEPERLLRTWPHVTEYLHGNPYQDRKIVLSQELLDNNELTPVTIERGDMKKRFLHEVERGSAEAVRLNRPLLLMAFCHGIEDHSLVLDNSPGTSLKISELKDKLASGCRVTLLTTACFSGGWAAVDLKQKEHSSLAESMNSTLLSAATNRRVSDSWVQSNSIGKRACGSIFASAFIERLTHESSDLLTRNVPGAAGPFAMPGHNGAALQPNPATDDQAKTYNEFCRAILDTCRLNVTRLWQKHNFTFAAQDDQFEYSWTGRTGIPLRDFQQRWGALRNFPYTGSQQKKDDMDPSPSNKTFDGSIGTSRTGSATLDYITFERKWIESASQHRLKAMAKVYLEEACPGDSSKGYGQLVTGLLNDAAEGTPIPDDEYEEGEVRIDVAAMLSFRVGMGRLADLMVEQFGLTFPGGKRCIVWHEDEWIEQCRPLIRGFERHHDDALSAVIGAEIAPEPTPEQGPPFHRFHAFLAAAIVDSTITGERVDELAKQMARFTRILEGHTCERFIMEDQALRSRGRVWLKTLGRRVRRSLSPRKSLSRRSSDIRDREDVTSSPHRAGDLRRRSSEFLRRSGEHARNRGDSFTSPRQSGEFSRPSGEPSRERADSFSSSRVRGDPFTTPRQSGEFSRPSGELPRERGDSFSSSSAATPSLLLVKAASVPAIAENPFLHLVAAAKSTAGTSWASRGPRNPVADLAVFWKMCLSWCRPRRLGTRTRRRVGVDRGVWEMRD